MMLPHRHVMITTILLLVIASVVTAATTNSTTTATTVGASDTKEQTALFHQMDGNHDQQLSLQEFTSNYHLLQQSPTWWYAGEELKSFWSGFSTSATMIIATEIGDKTFFIAAVLSMRNSRFLVFIGSIFALIVMTVLSTMMGLILPSIVPKSYTHWIASLLFFYFGCKLIHDSTQLKDYKVSDELEEVEEDLLLSSGNKKKDLELGDLELVRSVTPTTSNSTTSATSSGTKGDATTPHHHTSTVVAANESNSSSSSSSTKLLCQAFLLTFLAEWGDRSQIATIALASNKNPYGVTLGACFGHMLCTGMAVVGGRILASKISEKTVLFYGGLVFFAFGVHSLLFEE